ncbi:MAG: redoxin family protein [Elusimicrobia bacterium]|nr:redoxin family protein [Elusimicrobiota bacterium]
MKALALAALLAAPAAAVRPLTPPAPGFPADSAWLNSSPLPLSLLRGRKAVVVAFLNPTGLDSIRELSVLKAWFDRYALSQLMVVGVVTPAADFQRDVLWLRAELKRQGVEFPVVVDGDRKLWAAYGAQGWPALFLIDRKGRIVYDQLGEGGYADFERELRAALGEFIGASSLPPAVDIPEPRSRDCGQASADAVLGASSARPALELPDGAPRLDSFIPDSRLGEIALRGRWKTTPDGLRLERKNDFRDSFVRVVYRASQVLAVLAPPSGQSARMFVKRDDQWLHEGDAGRDVRFDEDGRSYVDVSSPRLYDLVRDDGAKMRELLVLPDRRGAAIDGFQFADACLVTDLP